VVAALRSDRGARSLLPAGYETGDNKTPQLKGKKEIT
jgi:hypothetical protein